MVMTTNVLVDSPLGRRESVSEPIGSLQVTRLHTFTVIANTGKRTSSTCRVMTSAAGGDDRMSGDCGRYRLLIHSARELVQISATGERRLTGTQLMNSPAVLQRRHDGQGVSVVVNR